MLYEVEIYLPPPSDELLALVMFQLDVDGPQPTTGEVWMFEEHFCRVRIVGRHWGIGAPLAELHVELELLPDTHGRQTAREVQDLLVTVLDQVPAAHRVQRYADDARFLDRVLE